MRELESLLWERVVRLDTHGTFYITAVFPEKIFGRMVRNVSACRAGEHEEISTTIAFLCGEDDPYIVGQTLDVNVGRNLPSEKKPWVVGTADPRGASTN